MLLRSAFIYLSRHRGLRRWMETSKTARRMAGRFVAGNTLDQALDVCRQIQSEGLRVTLDYLGENVTSPEEAAACRDTCLLTLDAMAKAGLEPNISVKLTQLGLGLSIEECERNVEALAAAASNLNGFLRVDMESSEYTDRTIGMVTRLHARYRACGTVIQAYLYRSEKDVECLSREAIRIRLCKGAYLEPGSVAFPKKRDVDLNYLQLTDILMQRGTYPAIATHDPKMIAGAKAIAAKTGKAMDQFEFQMLYGIRRDLQKKLLAEGYRVRLYVPYGEAWYPYFMRRLAERPANLFFLARNVIRN